MVSQQVHQRAKRSLIAVIVRQVFVQLFNVMTGIVLAKYLSPEVFGIYSILGFFVSFITVLGGVSLSYSLVVREQEPSEQEYARLFTLQFLLSVALAAVLLVVWRWIPALGSSGVEFIVYAVAVSLVLLSFQSTPQIQLERHLQFPRIAVYEVAQAVVFNVMAMVLSMQGYGARGLALALVARVLTGVILIHLLQKLPIRFDFQFAPMRKEIRYGLAYVSGQAVNLVKDTISPIFIGSLYGVAVVGYINFATMIASYPTVIMGVLQRVITSYFARNATEPERLSGLFRKILLLILGPLLLMGVGVYLLRHWIVDLFGQKWVPSLDLFLPFVLLNGFLMTAMLCICLVNALEKPRVVSLLMGSWAILTWILGVALVPKLGWVSWGWINLGINVLNVVFFGVTQRVTGVKMFVPVMVFNGCYVAGVLGLAALGL